MKNIKAFEDEPVPDDEVVYYSFMPLFDDDFEELADGRRATLIRLINWMLQSLNITPEEFLKQVKADEPPK